MKSNESSKIVVLEDEVLLNISKVFMKIPFEYSMGTLVGKNYLASKDFLLMHHFELKQWLEVILNMGLIWVNNRKA